MEGVIECERMTGWTGKDRTNKVKKRRIRRKRIMGMVKSLKLTMAAVFISVCMLAGGCSRFDASMYTQAVLDASYKNQTEMYVELTDIAKQEADTIFQTNLDATMEAFKSEKLSPELEAQYRELFSTIIKQVKYTVGEGQKKDNGGYEVEVSVEPITLFDDTYQTFQVRAEEYAKEITDSVMNGAALPADEEIQEHVYQLYYEILKTELDAGVRYGEVEQVLLYIEKTEDGQYRINKENLRELDGKMISRKVMTDNFLDNAAW